MCRVVVTGIGVVSSIGLGEREFWSGLLAGRCGVGDVTSFDTTAYKVHCGCEVRGFRPESFVRRLSHSTMGRSSQLAIAAARLALLDAGLEDPEIDHTRWGVVVGTTTGEAQIIEKFDDRIVADNLDGDGDSFVTSYPCNLIAAHVADEFELDGPSMVIPTACAAGNYAIACAMDQLKLERADLMLAGGADGFSRITYTGFARLGAIAPDRCRPFDKNRKGMIPGEGSGMLVLEPLDRALARQARIYAEVAGYGLSCDAHHMTASHPEGDGAVRAMEMALDHCSLEPEQVSYISAHGTGTPTNDRVETTAIKRVFGKAAYQIPVSSIKSMLGHAMGAASALEAAACALAIHSDHIPPTMHLEEPDPECDLDYVPNRSRTCRVDVAMNNAYAFGGNNASVILKRWNGVGS